MGPHVSFNSTWQLSSSPRLQWQHVIIGQRTLTWWYMDVCIMYTVPLWHHHHECRISTHCNYLVVMSVSWRSKTPPATASSRSWCHHSQSFNSNYSSTHWQDEVITNIWLLISTTPGPWSSWHQSIMYPQYPPFISSCHRGLCHHLHHGLPGSSSAPG